jgi:hypothetical protein
MWPRFGRSARPRADAGDGKSLYMTQEGRPVAAVQAGPAMSDIQRPTHSQRRDVPAGGGALFSMLFHLWPYIWPTDRRDLKGRVVFAMVLIFAAKLATIAVPFTFKWATDALTGHGTAPIGPNDWLAWAMAAPVAFAS